jgi:hypothetical protein
MSPAESELNPPTLSLNLAVSNFETAACRVESEIRTGILNLEEG